MQNKINNTIFTTDLLKGQGVPIKSDPKAMAIVAVSFIAPVIIAIIMLGFYLCDRITIFIQRQAIVNYEAKIDKMSDTVELQNNIEGEKNNTNNVLSEVKDSINRHIQWSGILAALAKDMPDSIILTQLLVKENFIRKNVPKKDEPQKMIDISVPVRILQIRVSGNQKDNCDEAVREFENRLRSSTSLGPRIEDIKVSKEVDTRSGNDLACYEIDCTFKPSL